MPNDECQMSTGRERLNLVIRASSFISHYSFVISHSPSQPRADRALSRRLRDRLGRRIAERKQHTARAVGLAAVQFVERLAKCGEAEIRFALPSIDAIEKRRDVDQLRARVHEVEIEELLAGHGFKIKLEIRSSKFETSSKNWK